MLEVKRKKTQVFWEFNVCSWIASEFSICLHCYIMFFRSSHQSCFTKKVFLEISQDSQESICARVFFLIKLQVWGLQQKSLWYRCFPVNFVKFLRTPFLQNTSGRLLLCFEHAQIFHISHFTYHLRYYMIIDYCWSC